MDPVLMRILCAVILAAAIPFAAGESFEMPMRIKVGRAPGSVEIADVNQDGSKDLIVANENDDSVTILLGDGKGKFADAKGSPFPVGHLPNDVAMADFDRNGQLDLAFANHEEKHLTVLLGDGHGSFAPAPGSPFHVDVKPHTHGVAAADLNGDGNVDLITDSWGDNRLGILYGDGKGSFAKSTIFVAVGKHPYQRARVADLDRDGRADIIATNLEGGDVTVLLGDGAGNFRQPPHSPFACGDSPFAVAAGDLNGDGLLDLAIANSPSSTADPHGRDGLTVLLGDGTGDFKAMPGSPFPAGTTPNHVAVADLNADGVADIVVSDVQGGRITLFLMSKNGGVAARSTIATGRQPKGIALGDLNGDGRADIAVAENGDNRLSIFFHK